MILASQSFHSENTHRPALVFLHGLLGSSNDWREIIADFPDWHCLAIDLPGHGASNQQHALNFEETCVAITATLEAHHIENHYLVGYSLGGRIAMTCACNHKRDGLHGLIVESAHPGLNDESERTVRRNNDQYWAHRFQREPLSDVLRDWYRQPVFASLSETQRQRLIDLRSHNDAHAIAAMLLATSLAEQPGLEHLLKKLPQPFLYLCGEHDQKFHQLAKTLFPTSLHVIPDAGHNAHRDQPTRFIAALRQFLS